MLAGDCIASGCASANAKELVGIVEVGRRMAVGGIRLTIRSKFHRGRSFLVFGDRVDVARPGDVLLSKIVPGDSRRYLVCNRPRHVPAKT